MTRRLRLGLLALVIAACSPWPAFVFPEPLPFDDRLGALILESFPTTPINVRVAGGEDIWVAIDQRAGLDVDLIPSEPLREVRVYDNEDLSLLRTLPYPGDGSETVRFGTSIDPGEALALTESKAFLSQGERWEEIPLFEGALSTSFRFYADGPSAIVAVDPVNDNQILISEGDGRWSALEVPPEADEYGLASMGGGILQVAWVTGLGDLCTAPFEFPSTQPTGDVVCAGIEEEVSTITFVEVNGNPDDFQLAFAPRNLATGTHRLFHYKNGAFSRGDTIQGDVMVQAPGSQRILIETQTTISGADIQDYKAYERGRIVDGGLAPFAFYLSCPCSREADPSCECHSRDFQGAIRFNQDMTQVQVTAMSAVDARRTVSIQSQALPLPMGLFGGAECTENCEDPTQTQTPSAVDYNVTLQGLIEMAEPGDAEDLTIEIRSTIGGADGVVIQGAPNLIAEVEDSAAYEVHYSHPAYAPRSIEAITGFPDSILTLNAVYMTQGLNLGLYSIFEQNESLSLPLAISPETGAMVLAVAGEWVHLERSGNAIGLTSRSLGAHPTPASDSTWGFGAPQLAPDGSMALVEVEGGFTVYNLWESEDVDLGVYGTPHVLEAAVFAGTAPVLGVPKAGNAPGGLGGLTLFTGGVGVQEASLRIDAEGYGNAISSDGNWIYRVEGGRVVRYHLYFGERTAMGPLPTSEGVHLIPGVTGASVIAIVEPTDGPGCLGAGGCQAYLFKEGQEPIDLGTNVLGVAPGRSKDAFALATSGDSPILHIPEGATTPQAVDASTLGVIDAIAAIPGSLVIRSGTQVVSAGADFGTLWDHGEPWAQMSTLGDMSVALLGTCEGEGSCRVGQLKGGASTLAVDSERDTGLLYGPEWDRSWALDDALFELSVTTWDPGAGAIDGERRVSRGVPGIRLPAIFMTPMAIGAPCLPFTRFQETGQVLYCVN